MRNTYEPHQQRSTTEHRVPDLGQVQTNAAGLNVLIGTNLHPYLNEPGFDNWNTVEPNNSIVKFSFYPWSNKILINGSY